MDVITMKDVKIKKKPSKNHTTRGTKEWADKTINFQFGCKNGCLYCYGCKMAIRFYKIQKRFNSLESWTENISINKKNVEKGWRKAKGRIMIPSAHDIYTENLSEALIVIRKLLEAGNELLIVSKPKLKCIQTICKEFIEFKSQMQFRFTITSLDNETLKLWEPNAPSFEERFQALQHAFYEGYKTSISIEPYLDYFVSELIQKMEPFVTDSIWVGIMNKRMSPKEGRDLYDKRSFELLYSVIWIQSKLSDWKKEAKGKLRLKDSIVNLLEKANG